MKRLPMFCAVTILLASARAGSPPDVPFDSIDWPPTMTKEPTKGFSMGKLRVRFEKTTLSEVQHTISTGAVDQTGDAGEHVLWLCYTTRGLGNPARIWIYSHGEMGGATHVVTGVTVSRAANASPTADCPALPAAMEPIHFDVPVWIGSPDARVETALGLPSHREGLWRSYDFRGKVRDDGQCNGGYDLTNWMITKSDHGAVTSIYAGQVTSC